MNSYSVQLKKYIKTLVISTCYVNHILLKVDKVLTARPSHLQHFTLKILLVLAFRQRPESFCHQLATVKWAPVKSVERAYGHTPLRCTTKGREDRAPTKKACPIMDMPVQLKFVIIKNAVLPEKYRSPLLYCFNTILLSFRLNSNKEK